VSHYLAIYTIHEYDVLYYAPSTAAAAAKITTTVSVATIVGAAYYSKVVGAFDKCIYNVPNKHRDSVSSTKQQTTTY
jgi:hypothetical protein